MSETIYDSDFTKYLPQPLMHDSKMTALAKAAAGEMLAVSKEVKKVLIYSQIEALPEELVDILAYDLHIDWYDYSFSLEEKRSLLKNSIKVHKKIGTKYAVEKVLQSFCPGSRVEEWFEYGGRPNYFRIMLNMDKKEMTAKNNKEYEVYLEKILSGIRMYKRLTARLDEIHFEKRVRGRLAAAAAKWIYVRCRIEIHY